MKKIFFVVLTFLTFNYSTWEKSKHIWTFDIICNCDYGTNRDSKLYFKTQDKEPFQEKYYQNIRPYSKVWIIYKHIKDFYGKNLKNNTNPIILTISGCNNTFPDNCKKNFDPNLIIDHSSIIHIFDQNNNFSNCCEKISSTPIDIDYHNKSYRGENSSWEEKEQLINIINSSLPITSMINKGNDKLFIVPTFMFYY